MNMRAFMLISTVLVALLLIPAVYTLILVVVAAFDASFF